MSAARLPFEPARLDPRCSSGLYLPGQAGPLPLLVAVHGSGREAEQQREAFVPFADRHRVAVLAPLFPREVGDPDGYKRLEDAGIRYDRILLGMVEDLRRTGVVDRDPFLLAGFSGGAQLAHRFALLHPQLLRGAVVAAPGKVTLPDDEPWPLGLGDVTERFGSEVDLDALRALPIGVVVGAADTDAAEVAAWMTDPRELRTGRTRVERARTLAAALRGLGVEVSLQEVPGAGHDLDALVPAMTAELDRISGGR